MADNRRVRMTKKLIKDAYLELLEKRPSERISVTDICKTADVNRSTFYMYYEDTIRLRQDIENDVLAQIPVLTDGSAPVTTDRQFVTLLERFFRYILDNRRMFRILFLQSDSRAFNRRLMEKVFEKYRTQSSIKDPLLAEYAMVSARLTSVSLEEAYIEGFRTGARIMLAVLQESKDEDKT